MMLFLTAIVSVVASIAGGVLLSDNKDLSCNCGGSDCICPNLTIPQNVCAGVTVQPADINITYDLKLPTCIMSGCLREIEDEDI